MNSNPMYENEEKIIIRAKQFLAQEGNSLETFLEEYGTLVHAYESLLADVKFITKISDRLQNKLNTINESLIDQTIQLESAQKQIEKRNDELKITKLELEDKVSERTRELKLAVEDLLVTNKELDNFVYRASHDLRGPIANISGLCKVAIIDVEDQKSLEYFHLLENTSAKMGVILTRLLQANTLKKSQVVKRKFNLPESVNKVQESIFRLRGSDKIKFDFHHSNLSLHSDQGIFELLITNILEYAIRNSAISHAEGTVPFVTMKFLEEDRNVQIYMTYNGEEIPKRVLGKIFDLFHRTSNHPDHTGIELYMANLASKKLNGTIEVISSNEEETMFSVFLPNIAY